MTALQKHTINIHFRVVELIFHLYMFARNSRSGKIKVQRPTNKYDSDVRKVQNRHLVEKYTELLRKIKNNSGL
jgi:hypothetical protein